MTYHRILIIDDNENIHEDFRKILTGRVRMEEELSRIDTELFGLQQEVGFDDKVFEVVCQLSGEAGLESVERGWQENLPFSVVFLDLEMSPGWNGIQTAEKLWEVDPNLQIVTITGFSKYEWKEIAAGAKHTDQLLFLKKPCDPVVVRLMANSLSERWSARRLRTVELDTLRSDNLSLRKKIVELEAMIAGSHK